MYLYHDPGQVIDAWCKALWRAEFGFESGCAYQPERIEQAQGILVAALGVLAKYYGYGGR